MPARLVVQKGPYPNQEYLLSESPMSVGRSPDNEIAIQDPEISRRHARITYSGGLYQIEDSGSTNGSFVNGRRVQGTVILQHGDRILLGESITLIFQEDEPPPGYADEEDINQAWNTPSDMEATVADFSAPMPPHPPPAAAEWNAPAVPTATPYQEPESGPSRTRQVLLGCGCGFLLFGVLCVALFFFLDAYDQGRLLYCGPLYPWFDSMLGPLGFNPACQPPA
ncbi:MAG: FHA domain-containing protein [Chloroflexota bacterium]